MNEYGEPPRDEYREPPTAQYPQYGIVRPRRRRHPIRTLTIVVVALIIVLVGLDFGARAVAENVMASQIKDQGFPKKPSVSIEGFPFLTQVISRDFRDVNISSSDVTEGPLQIASVNATMTGVHVSTSFKSGTIDHLSGTLDVLGTSGTAVWRITRTGPRDMSVQLVSSSGLTGGLLGSIGNINIPLPSLPVGLSIQNVSVTPNGLVGTVTGQNVKFGS